MEIASCFCSKLRKVTSLLIGVTYFLIFCGLIFYGLFLTMEFVQQREKGTLYNIDNYLFLLPELNYYVGLPVVIMFSTIHLIFACLLIHGIIKQKPKHIFNWLCANMFLIVICIITMVVVTFGHYAVSDSQLIATGLAIAIATIAWFCVLSEYSNIKKSTAQSVGTEQRNRQPMHIDLDECCLYDQEIVADYLRDRPPSYSQIWTTDFTKVSLVLEDSPPAYS